MLFVRDLRCKMKVKPLYDILFKVMQYSHYTPPLLTACSTTRYRVRRRFGQKVRVVSCFRTQQKLSEQRIRVYIRQI